MKKQILILTIAFIALTAAVSACCRPAGEAASAPSFSGDEITEDMPGSEIEYCDVVELQKAVRFRMLGFQQEETMENSSYYMIEPDGIGQITGTNDAGNEICIRQAAGSGNISGYPSAAYENKTVGDVEVHIGKSENSLIAWWNLDDFAFSLSVRDIDPRLFNTYIETLVDVSQFNAGRGPYTDDIAYRDCSSLVNDLGFSPLLLPHVYGMEPSAMYQTADGRALITYRKDYDQVPPDFLIELYTEKGTTVSGIYLDNAEYKEITVKNISVHSGLGTGPTAGVHSAYWTDGKLSYQIVALGQNSVDFQTLLRYLVTPVV